MPQVPQRVQWISGPAVASLGTIAEIRIPEGYRFTDANGARARLMDSGSRVPTGLLGMLEPELGGWRAVLEFKRLGYITEAQAQAACLDPSAALNSFRQQTDRYNQGRGKLGLSSVGIVDWGVKPAYDPASRLMEWSLSCDEGPGKMINHTLRLLARQGVLDAVALYSSRTAPEPSRLRELVRAVSFKPGERYDDYRKGDKVSTASSSELIAAESGPEETVTAAADSGEGKAFWIVLLAVFSGFATVCVVLIVHGVRRRKSHSTNKIAMNEVPTVATDQSAPEEGPVAVPKSQSAMPAPMLKQKTAIASRPGMSNPSRTAAKKAAVNKQDRQNVRRRKVFDYNRYFNDLLSSVSNHSSYVVETPATMNGFMGGANGGVNGNGNGHFYEAPKTVAITPQEPVLPTPTVLSTHSELLATQKSLIEEQRRLIQEQNRLIEEKARLIAEKNQLLKMQSELIDNKLL